MADRCRYSRRPDQCASDKADELSHIPVQHFFKRPPRLHLRHSAADRANLYLFPRLHRAAADPMIYVYATMSMLMAAFMQFFITYSLAMMAFWILEISTIVFIVYSFEYFLGGQMFPIDIMPPAVQAVMKWLPFYYELFCPIAIFLGRLKGADSCASPGDPNRLAVARVGLGKLHVETRPRPLPGRRRIIATNRCSISHVLVYVASFCPAEARSFSNRGSRRSGSNIGSSRSNAGVIGAFEAKGPVDGIESSFCNAAMARSGSPSRAATRAKISIGIGPCNASFSSGMTRMARSARLNAAVLSPRPILISARSPITTKFSGCSLRRDSNSVRACFQLSSAAAWSPPTSCAQPSQKRNSPL